MKKIIAAIIALGFGLILLLNKLNRKERDDTHEN